MKSTRRLPERQVDPDGEHILDRIVRKKRDEIEALRSRAGELRKRAAEAPPPRDFAEALATPERLSVIAEVKRRSPGAGAIRTDLDPVALARSYVSGGAAAISVLTDEPWFAGRLQDLTEVRAAVPVPCLRKDFILEEVQVHEARAAGADAILLIVRILDDGPLRELREVAESLGMAVLVEVHDRPELHRALDSGAHIIGINNRDLSTFTTDLQTTLELAGEVPTDRILVSESGIRTGADAAKVAEAGADAILVGEALVRAPDPVALAGELAAPRPDRAGRAP